MDQKFWNDVYSQKSEKEVSWYQDSPAKSLALIEELGLAQSDSILDVGGGESRLADELLRRGFSHLTVLDISSVALAKVGSRLGPLAQQVKFIVSDVTKFHPPEKYQLWHDRATFHFLTSLEDIETYLDIASRSIAPGGFLIVSTFSKTGPDKCSGLRVSQYSDADLKKMFEKHFANVRCFEDSHTTPWGAEQNFVYCGFKKRP